MSKTFNGILVEARYKPIIELLKKIKTIVMRRTVAIRAYVSKFKG